MTADDSFQEVWVEALQLLLQQLINGVQIGSVYALIAIGYTMVYGVLRFINFAHSDVLMLGAFAAFFVTPLAEKVFGAQSIPGALVVFIVTALICALIGML